MRLAVDASVLVAELTRRRGRSLISLSALEFVVAAHAWDEVTYELPRRLAARERHGRLVSGGADLVLRKCLSLAAAYVTVVPSVAYESFEALARRRVPRDPRDWPTVALAMALEAGIWTADADCLGCGLPTWTTEALLLASEA
ncbi:MAG: nucleotide-binding protein, PIN domain-containing protein [Chloroflexi bacterium]|nr:nucleotide-binding protein, PIN domain-containing protein [Chloroflexota bacterium]